MVTPKTSLCSRLAILFAISSLTGANVVIVTDERPNECGRSLTLTCKLKQYTSSVEWMKHNNVVPIARCVRKNCVLNPNYFDKYNFTQDIGHGVFNLTINTLTMNDNASKFVCSDGYYSDLHTVIVRDDEPKLIEDLEKGIITATSGCVPQGTNVTIKWRKIVTESMQEIEKELKPEILSTSYYNCSIHCGDGQKKMHIESIVAIPNGNGNFLRIVAVYGNVSIESNNTISKYTSIEDDENEDHGKSDDRKIHHGYTLYLVIAYVVGGVFLGVVLACFFVWMYRRPNKNNNDGAQIYKTLPHYDYSGP